MTYHWILSSDSLSAFITYIGVVYILHNVLQQPPERTLDSLIGHQTVRPGSEQAHRTTDSGRSDRRADSRIGRRMARSDRKRLHPRTAQRTALSVENAQVLRSECCAALPQLQFCWRVKVKMYSQIGHVFRGLFQLQSDNVPSFNVFYIEFSNKYASRNGKLISDVSRFFFCFSPFPFFFSFFSFPCSFFFPSILNLKFEIIEIAIRNLNFKIIVRIKFENFEFFFPRKQSIYIDIKVNQFFGKLSTSKRTYVCLYNFKKQHKLKKILVTMKKVCKKQAKSALGVISCDSVVR